MKRSLSERHSVAYLAPTKAIQLTSHLPSIGAMIEWALPPCGDLGTPETTVDSQKQENLQTEKSILKGNQGTTGHLCAPCVWLWFESA